MPREEKEKKSENSIKEHCDKDSTDSNKKSKSHRRHHHEKDNEKSIPNEHSASSENHKSASSSSASGNESQNSDIDKKNQKEKNASSKHHGGSKYDDDDDEECEYDPQSEAEITSLQSHDCIFLNVLEAKGIKPGNYAVCIYGEKRFWKTSWTKRSTKWDEKGRIFIFDNNIKKIRAVVREKGVLVSSILGEYSWDINDIIDGYPYQDWKELEKNGKPVKIQVKFQIMFLPQGVTFSSDAFTTPIHYLIQKKKFDLFKRSIESNRISQTDSKNRSPLHYCIEVGEYDYIKVLLKEFEKIQSLPVTDNNETVLHWAALHCNNSKIISLLLKFKGIGISDLTLDKGQTALHYACTTDNVQVLKQLVEAGASIEAVDADQNTPIIIALLNNSVKCVEELNRLNCDIYHKNDKNLTVWEISQRKDLVNTEARRAFMEFLGVNDPREFPFRKHYPQKAIFRGNNVARDYEESTQFVISSEKATTVCVLTTSIDIVNASEHSSKVSFIVIESLQGEHNEPAFTRDAISFSCGKVIEIKINPKFFYFILPYAKHDLMTGPFNLIALSKKKAKIDIKEAKPWANCTVIEGGWEGETAGGAQPATTWINNPKYEICFPNKDGVKFTVLLTQDTNDPQNRCTSDRDHRKIPYEHGIGFYILDRGAAKTLEQTVFYNARDVHKEFVMDFSQRNHIVILPATYKPNVETEFTLRVFCDDPITIKEV